MNTLRFWKAARTGGILTVYAAAYLALGPADTPAGNSLNERVLGKARDVLFNYIQWEADAVGQKIGQHYAGVGPHLTDAQGARFVYDYLDLVRKLQSTQAQIDSVYADPKIADHDAASVALRSQRDTLSAQVSTRQPLTESIIEQQIGAVLLDEGFGTLGSILPPVSTHLTELPMLLVISPRESIRFEMAINVRNLNAEDSQRLEDGIDHDLNVSSLAVPLGGLSLYPSMAQQSSYAFGVFDTVAHEWTHHYLYFFPLGLEYESNNATRIINESTASFLGGEVGAKVIQRFYSAYPDVMAQLPKPTPANPAPPAPGTFDIGAALNETRVQVDALLAAGMVADAEAYMETQRQLINSHGYGIRKLNQAYFAFYGGYQAAQGGAGGSDPTGPAITEIRQRSPSLKAWLETMRSITSLDALLAARDKLRQAQ